MAKSCRGWYWHVAGASFLAMGGAIASSFDYALAQITPDGTLGAESSVVTPNVDINGLPSDRIDGGANRGTNLFHSFREFNIGEGQRAYFTNPDAITNILSRVTGNDPSDILGTLGVLGNANLFLINPNGIIFGANARLDIGGSFVGSTANSLNFADGTSFSATAHPTTSLLTISVPIGLQYGSNASSTSEATSAPLQKKGERGVGIQVQGNGQGLRATTDLIDTTVGLRVQPNQTLALVGGDVALLGGTLKTAGGRIELGSVAGSGLVSLIPTELGLALGYSGVANFGDIHLSGTAAVDASGEGGGDIQVQGRRVTLQDGSQIEASTLGAEPGGTLAVTASESVEAIGITADGQFSSALATFVYPGATGAGGNLILETGRLIVRDGAQIGTSTFGSGAGGNLVVSARESVELIGRTADLQLASGLFTSVQEGATDDSGNLTLETGRLIVRDGATVFTGTFGSGAGGNLVVSARESVEVIGSSADGQRQSSLTAQTSGTGNVGDLTIETGRLNVRDEARVTVSSNGTGNAGNLEVAARSIRLEDLAVLSADTAAEQGNIILHSGDLVLRRGSNITTNATGTATGGNITLNTDVLAAFEDSDISANAQEASGGRVIINASGIFGTEFRNQPTTEFSVM
jgi:filamentous hemagglutinin family protein